MLELSEQGVTNPVLDRMKRMDKALEDIETKAWEAKMALLQREVEREWRKIQKKRPHWREVRFGNGTFVVLGMRRDEEPWATKGHRQTLSGWVTELGWQGPEYLRYFWFLCEAAEGGLNDLVRT